MSALALRLPPQLAATTTLATQIVDGAAPPWAVSPDSLSLHNGVALGIRGSRTEKDIFRLPNSNATVRDWLYSRPEVDALGEDAFDNAAIESSSVFRMHPLYADETWVKITPTVSNHWLMVPLQSVNGVTVGLAYLDVLYEKSGDDLRVPSLPVGKFAIEDLTGEVFITGWGDSIMIVGWIQSIIKCERVRELLMFAAPPANGMQPDLLLRRNSFYERRDCRLCGIGTMMSRLRDPCSGIGGTLSQDPTIPPPLTNVATLYRRFRGSYYGICLKTSYSNRQITGSIPVLVLVDVRHGLYTVKQRFRKNLQNNVSFALDCMNDGLFGLNPVTSSKLFIFKSSQPVTSNVTFAVESSACMKRKANSESSSEGIKTECSSMMTHLDPEHDANSHHSSERSNSPPAKTRRRVGVDDMDRDTIQFERRRKNRIAAEKSNKERKLRLQREKEELAKLKKYKLKLEKRQNELSLENFVLKLQTQPSASQSMLCSKSMEGNGV